MEPRLSLSGGLGVNSLGYESSFPSSYVIDFEGSLYLNRNIGIRLYVDCNFFSNSENYSYNDPYDPYYSYNEEGGNTSVYILTFDLLAGSLKPEQKTKQYFICGIGAFVFSESDRKTHSGHGNYTYPGESFEYGGLKIGYGINHNFTPRISAGGELLYGTVIEYMQIGILSVKPRISYKLSKKFELFFEPQYTFPVAFGDFGGFFIDNGYFTVKTGIALTSF